MSKKTAYVIFEERDVERDVPHFTTLLKAWGSFTVAVESPLADGGAKVCFTGEDSEVDQVLEALASGKRSVFVQRGSADA